MAPADKSELAFPGSGGQRPWLATRGGLPQPIALVRPRPDRQLNDPLVSRPTVMTMERTGLCPDFVCAPGRFDMSAQGGR
jgi:hypothetical protein